ncbi:M23 family metallopeptidase [Actinotalea sp. Marseille-Q4924]|uniref:M23 family metallopeptidase n=1 Tax=Actinotalea sp. Marseille-Q4924 TaxID=2866571 RepID=UPI002714823D|nr:M23 family metallopeptidase [Actinotalea sp. Marseille-Q4924]
MRTAVHVKLLAAAAALTLGVAVAVPVQATEYDDQRARAEEGQRSVGLSLEEIDELLEDTDAALVAAYAEREAIAAQLPSVEAELASAEDTLARLQLELALLEQRLLSAEASADAIAGQIRDDTERAVAVQSSIGEIARKAYQGDLAGASLSVLFDARNWEEAVAASTLTDSALRVHTQALRELEQARGTARNQEARLAAVEAEIADLTAETGAKVADADAARVAVQARQDELLGLLAEQDVKTAAIEAQRGDQLAAKARYEAQQAALADELKEIIEAERLQERRREVEREEERRREAERTGSQSTPGAPPPPVPSVTGGSIGPGILGSPSPMNPPVITSPYGYRIHPIYGYRKLHAGTDFRAYCGTPIVAAASGTVQWAKPVGGFGNQVMLNHGSPRGTSLMTSYNHLSSFAVRTSEQVKQGQVIGYSGTTGTSTACHLHFEAYLDGDPVDPETLL